MIDPAFWQSESVARLPVAVRYFFIGLFSNADDQGRMKAHPALLRSTLYPYDDIDLHEIETMLEWLCNDFIIVYEADSKEYLQILNWWKYQRPRWAWPSDHPAPEGWKDRVHYRQGNAVMKENWDDPEPNAAPLPQNDDSQSGATVEPPRNQTGTTVEPAPSGSNSTSGSGSTSGSDQESADAGAIAPVTFQDWQTMILHPPNGSNRTAVLVSMHQALFPNRDPPKFGYMGKMARDVGGAGRMAELLWQASSRPPTGDVLRYCAGIAKGQKRDDNPDITDIRQVTEGEYAEWIET